MTDEDQKLNADPAEELFNKGISEHDKKDYKSAIDYFSQAIDIGYKKDSVYNRRANAYYALDDYVNALSDYTKAIELNSQDSVLYFNRSGAYSCLRNYNDAFQDINKAIELNPKYSYAYNRRGKLYYEQGNSKLALIDLNKALDLEPKNLYAYNNRGHIYYDKDDYLNALKDYTKAIELSPDDSVLYNNRGNAYYYSDDIENALNDYEKAVEINKNLNYKALITVCKKHKKYTDRVARILTKADKDIVEFFSEGGWADALVSQMLDIEHDNNYFFTTLRKHDISKEDPNYRGYKDIFMQSIKIMCELYVSEDMEMERGIAHYTRKSVAEMMLFDHSKFRLGSIVRANDPEEGNVIYKYFGIDKQKNRTVSDYQAFLGCFTFNPECLNQFRLYGKDNGREATGVSLVFDRSFFSEKIDQQLTKQMNIPLPIGDEVRKEASVNKHPLFRCVYIDPGTRQIASLGHKEDYTFFRDELESGVVWNEDVIKAIDNQIAAYKKYLNRCLINVKKAFAKLQSLIRKAEGKDDLLYDLLINLRYLVKHVAFKEEQECRIIAVEKPDKNRNNKVKMDEATNGLHIETKDITNTVNKIYFGPQASGMGPFRDRLMYEGLSRIRCTQCTHPYATSD